MSDRKAQAFITPAIDCLDGKTMVEAYLHPVDNPGVRIFSFRALSTDAQLHKRLPEWLAELRAGAELGRCESLEEEKARLAGHIAADAAEQGVV